MNPRENRADSQLERFDYPLSTAHGHCRCSAGSQVTADNETIQTRTRQITYGDDSLYRRTNVVSLVAR